MEKINVKIKEKSKQYTIIIGSSITDLIKKFIAEEHKDKRVVIITDDQIKEICKPVLSSLKLINPCLISVPAGEQSKTRETKQEIEDKMLEKRYSRDTLIIAFGGGVIGDLAGFVASTYCRGIPYIQVPTTLLAMVDSSIGGKTAVDTKYGKNLIGTFSQPDAVFADLEFLNSLPKEEFLNGLAESVKIAITSDKELFSFIESNFKKILEKEKDALSRIIKRSIELKKDIVEKDEKESGLRQTLNLGHTFGHAYETYSNFKVKHGLCVSLGIAVETKIAVLDNALKISERERIISLLKALGLPAEIEKDTGTNEIIKLMEVDKKTKNHKPMFVILNKIGKIKTENSNFSFEVDENLVKKAIEASK